jgi:hypothetical protein
MNTFWVEIESDVQAVLVVAADDEDQAIDIGYEELKVPMDEEAVFRTKLLESIVAQGEPRIIAGFSGNGVIHNDNTKRWGEACRWSKSPPGGEKM